MVFPLRTPYPSLFLSKEKVTKDQVTFFVVNQGRINAPVVIGKILLRSPVLKVKNKIVQWAATFFRSTFVKYSLSTF